MYSVSVSGALRVAEDAVALGDARRAAPRPRDRRRRRRDVDGGAARPMTRRAAATPTQGGGEQGGGGESREAAPERLPPVGRALGGQAGGAALGVTAIAIGWTRAWTWGVAPRRTTGSGCGRAGSDGADAGRPARGSAGPDGTHPAGAFRGAGQPAVVGGARPAARRAQRSGNAPERGGGPHEEEWAPRRSAAAAPPGAARARLSPPRCRCAARARRGRRPPHRRRERRPAAAERGGIAEAPRDQRLTRARRGHAERADDPQAGERRGRRIADAAAREARDAERKSERVEQHERDAHRPEPAAPRRLQAALRPRPAGQRGAAEVDGHRHERHEDQCAEGEGKAAHRGVEDSIGASSVVQHRSSPHTTCGATAVCTLASVSARCRRRWPESASWSSATRRSGTRAPRPSCS